MHDDPNLEAKLIELAEGGHDLQLEIHVESCPSCQTSLFALRQLVQYRNTTGGALVEPPESLVTGVEALLAKVRPDLTATSRVDVRSEVLGGLRRIAAQLIFDSGVTTQLVGLRGSVDQRTRQIAFVSPVADLDLEVSRLGDEYSVAGQLGMDAVPPAVNIRFVPADQDPLDDRAPGAVATAVSDRGYFSLALPPGQWVASVEIDAAVVVFERFQL